jgi:hypothetical protein
MPAQLSFRWFQSSETANSGAGIAAAHISREVVRSMYNAAGASALYIDCPLERAHRDIQAVMQRIVFAPFWMEVAGQVRLGLSPGNRIF